MPFQNGSQSMRLHSLLLPKHWQKRQTISDLWTWRHALLRPNQKLKSICDSTAHQSFNNFLFLAEIISLKSNTTKIKCDCMQNCDNTNFFVQSIVSIIKIESLLITLHVSTFALFHTQRSRIWFLGANFQWGIIDYPKLQLKRELLFGISDVLGEKHYLIHVWLQK